MNENISQGLSNESDASKPYGTGKTTESATKPTESIAAAAIRPAPILLRTVGSRKSANATTAGTAIESGSEPSQHGWPHESNDGCSGQNGATPTDPAAAANAGLRPAAATTAEEGKVLSCHVRLRSDHYESESGRL